MVSLTGPFTFRKRMECYTSSLVDECVFVCVCRAVIYIELVFMMFWEIRDLPVGAIGLRVWGWPGWPYACPL